MPAPDTAPASLPQTDCYYLYWLSVAFSPGGKTIASGSADNNIKLGEVASGKNISTLIGHSSHVYSIAYSPDGKTLASGSGDYTIF
ncbi:MAG: hypothetical protein HXX20_14250 [Chloroflexi bacterium]|nr:hypothetical protein [Chloroflexota bacterium]